MDPRTTLQAFDAYLSERNLALEAVVIGGTALALLGVIARPTQDCDVLAPPLSEALREAARGFAQEARASGQELADDWLNNGPAQLASVYPDWPAHVDAVLEDVQQRLGRGAGHGL